MRRAPVYLALAALLASGAPARAAPLPADDGFLYPGQPGAEEAPAYLDRRDAQLGSVPAAATRWSREELDLVAWMTGRWRVAFRDFENGETTPAGAGRATIRLAPGARWLTITVDTPPERYRQLHLGFDPRTSLWVLHEVTAPPRLITGVRNAPGWQDGRLQFGVAEVSEFGFRSTRRDTIVRLDADRFRLVAETRLPGGQFVVLDDALFTRVR